MPILASLGAGSIGAYRLFRQVAAVPIIADGIDFDGTNDYLSRASDFTGNADGKTFTFSAWVWINVSTAGSGPYEIYSVNNNKFYVNYSGSDIYLQAQDSSGNWVLQSSAIGVLVDKTWNHIIYSVNLDNSAQRYLFVNDINRTSSVTWSTYNGTPIDFTQSVHTVASDTDSTKKVNGRLAHVYLDYTYRDLSVSANRRLFITADLKTATGQESLNPIMYLKLNDTTNPGKNSGTGGDFTLTGTVARSGRGPNQYNSPYVDLDGSTQYLNTGSGLTGASNGKQFTISFCINLDVGYTYASPFYIGTAGGPASEYRFYVFFNENAGNIIQIHAFNSSGSPSGYILNASSSAGALTITGKNLIVTASMDMSSTSLRKIYINGEDKTSLFTFSTYTNENIQFSSSYVSVASIAGSYLINGRFGSLLFHTSYVDLSVPSNLAKFVTGTGINAKPADPGADGSLPFGVQPLVYFPMFGRNPGKNYGSGGDFSVNSGPYTGARGPNEFFGSWANFDGATGYLSRGALSGVANTTGFTASIWTRVVDNSAYRVLTEGPVCIRRDTSNGLEIFDQGGRFYCLVASGDVTANTNHHILISIDNTSPSKRHVYVNGNPVSNTFTQYSSGVINMLYGSSLIGNGSHLMRGRIGEYYFAEGYTDLSQESNRLKFRDAFGNPVDLGSDGSNPTGSKPAVYMRFDPDSQGTNLGFGGNYSKTGTIVDGGSFT